MEVVEINFSTLDSVIDFRIEAEYFEKRFLNLEQKISKIETVPFNSIATAVNGRPYASEAFNFSEGIPVSKIGDVTNKRNLDLWEFITQDEFVKQKGIYLKQGDILMTLTGDPPDVGKVHYIVHPAKATWNQRVAKIRIKNKRIIISNEVLFILLSTYFSREQLERYAKGIRQRNLGNESLKRLQIPALSSRLQSQIEICVLHSSEKLELSKTAYNQAETLLLKALNYQIDNEQCTQNVNIKTFSESFQQSGRLDAEFYQVKYESYRAKIENYVNGFETVRSVCKLKDKNFPLKNDKHYHYIELSNIGNFGEITGSTMDLGVNLPSRARRKITENDVIISSIEGSLASCAIVSREYHNAICSTGFYVISSDKINAETLLVLFKSKLLQNILKQSCSGTILTAINKEEFLDIPLPLIDKETQTQISTLIQQSNRLRTESKQLLEKAKLAVELAIEKDESFALKTLL